MADTRSAPISYSLAAIAVWTAVWSAGCAGPTHRATRVHPTTGGVERLRPALDALIDPAARLEVLAEGFEWSEGPVWVRAGAAGGAGADRGGGGGFLLFSDIPNNVVHRFEEGAGTSVYLKPAGYTGRAARSGELGSNGLGLDHAGRLVLCQHGDRRVARMAAPLDAPRPLFVTLADRYRGGRLNSPNDLAFHDNGDLYFTDPPYGLEGGIDDAHKDLAFQGVYRRTPDGAVTLLTDGMTRPNGIAFAPDGRTLYVAQSDPAAALWMAFPVRDDGSIGAGRVLLDATASVGVRPGLPDGLKVDVHGNLFATGPGGVWVIAPDGTHLGTILTGNATANCAFGDDGHTLYVTADAYLMRVRLRTKGPGF